MAEANFDDFGEGGVSLRGLPTQKLINLAGGATSLLLVLGLAVWGYRLAVRDVNGIPVIQAMQGPMRIMPEDPGGQIAANVGLTVNRVAADAEGLPRTDNIILAPAPVQLSDGDLAPADRPTPAPAAAPAAPAQPQTAVAAVAAPAPVTPAAPDAAPALDAAVAAVPAPDATQAVAHGAPLTSPRPKAAPAFLLPAAVAKAAPVKAVPVPVVPVKAETAPAPSAAAAAVRAVAIPATAAKAPPARPASLATPAKPAKAPDSIDPAKLTPGTRLVQLGAYDTPDAAASAWAMIKAKFGDQMDGKSRVIQKATSGGRDFYRLRAAGFKDDADTRRFCTTFDAANAPCVPVVLR